MRNKITKAIREEAIASNNRAVDPNGMGVHYTAAAIGAPLLAADLAYEALEHPWHKGRYMDSTEWYARAAERLERGWRPRKGWRS